MGEFELSIRHGDIVAIQMVVGDDSQTKIPNVELLGYFEVMFIDNDGTFIGRFKEFEKFDDGRVNPGDHFIVDIPDMRFPIVDVVFVVDEGKG